MNPPIETIFPDIQKWAIGNTDVAYVWTFVADAPGPHVCVNALVHGNEVCGAIAADWLLRELTADTQHVWPLRGTLSVAFANVDAYLSFDATKPFDSRCIDEDFNRLWDESTLDGHRDSRELRRARDLRPFYDTVDHLLDLHSMLEPAPPISLAGDTAKGLALARAIGSPEHILVDSGHAAGKRLRDYAGFGDPLSAKSAVLIECGQHWEAAVGDVAKEVTLRFLRHFDVLDSGWIEGHLHATPSTPSQRVVDISTVVTHRNASFRWIRPVRGLEVIADAGTLLAMDGEHEVRTPQADAVLVMPVPNPKVGQTAVRIGRFRSP
ncbi:MAG: succinylglutamate desuccinylase/aspartoacylase family protein [Rhizobacter sp.]|nr:succinylglutamate desuccinylase/aspartoacylase family protein [Burkholderiales bacterium]